MHLRSAEEDRRGNRGRKSPDASAQSCSFRLPGAVDTEDKVIIAGARSSFKSTKCHYCSTQESADEHRADQLDARQEAEDEQNGIRVETKHEDNVNILILHHDDNTDETDDNFKPQQEGESGCDEVAPSRIPNDEDIIDSSPRATAAEDVPTTPPRDDTPTPDDVSGGDDDVIMVPNAPMPYIEENNLEEELEFFDENNTGDNNLDIDDLLDHCPQTAIITSLQSATELSRRYTLQIVEAINRWNEITHGPSPPQPGTSLTRSQVMDAKSSTVREESSQCLDEMNKAFFSFYCVEEELDNADMMQRHFVESTRGDVEEPAEDDSDSTTENELPRNKQGLADLYMDHRKERGFEKRKFETLLGERIPPTVEEEDEEEDEEVVQVMEEEDEEVVMVEEEEEEEMEY